VRLVKNCDKHEARSDQQARILWVAVGFLFTGALAKVIKKTKEQP